MVKRNSWREREREKWKKKKNSWGLGSCNKQSSADIQTYLSPWGPWVGVAELNAEQECCWRQGKKIGCFSDHKEWMALANQVGTMAARIKIEPSLVWIFWEVFESNEERDRENLLDTVSKSFETSKRKRSDQSFTSILKWVRTIVIYLKDPDLLEWKFQWNEKWDILRSWLAI